MHEQNKQLFSAAGLHKSYGNTHALQDVGFSVNRGEIVGLVGENGAGKSTLLRIIMGVEQPDAGSMEFDGKAYAPKNPREANALGVGMVFQEQSLLTNLTVAQNIFFGEEKKYSKAGFVNWRKMSQDARGVLDRISLMDIEPEKKISDLQFSRRQMVEIAKVLYRASDGREDGSLILLDEPTSVLNSEEIDILFDKARELRDRGNGVVFISHRLDEILAVCDRIFVFKDGQNVCDMPVSEANESVLYEKMVGKSSASEFYRLDRQTKPGDEVLIEAVNLSKYGMCKDVSFALRAGEILGLCGVVGSGKETLCNIISGDEKHTSGELKVYGKVKSFASPADALKERIVNVPTERRVEGQVGIASIQDNMIYCNMKKVSKNGLLNHKKQRELAQHWIERLRIKCQGSQQSIENLSGGNAQKVVFARVLSSDARVIILNHPTRGVDIGAKEDIYDIIRSATDEGIGIILLGDTLEECIGLANRILVMKDGLVTGEFGADAGEKPQQVDIIHHMM